MHSRDKDIRESYLLLEQHNLVTFKVIQVAADGSLGNLLSGSGSLKLGNNSRGFQVLTDHGSASSAGQSLHDKLGKIDAL